MTEASGTVSGNTARQWPIKKAETLLQDLFPCCRSLTGEGVRETFARLREEADFDMLEIPSGTSCFDWEVPDEWNVRDAYVADSSGRRIVDFNENNLHLVNYSVPVDTVLPFDELRGHLHTLPDMPEAIPYRTSYYDRTWGFCLRHDTLMRMDPDEDYHVYIDATLEPGSLTMAEAIVEGESDREFLISTYCCHPSMANDNLSGLVLWTLLLREFQERSTRHTYRFVAVPETIGALAYLAHNEDAMQHVDGGFVLTTVAGPGQFGYKSTFEGDHLIDRAARQTFEERGIDYITYPFDINGSDERQYSTPRFRIPCGTISKDKYFEYDEYHTSLDDLDFVDATHLTDSLELYRSALDKIERDACYRSLNDAGEPMLSKRGLYPTTGGSIKQRAASDGDQDHTERRYGENDTEVMRGDKLDAIRWLMFYGDGEHSLLDIAEETGLPFRLLHDTAEMLREHALLEKA